MFMNIIIILSAMEISTPIWIDILQYIIDMMSQAERMMETLLIGLGWVTLCFLMFIAFELTIGFKSIFKLLNQPLSHDTNLPKVSIIFSALNEEEDIEGAVLSMLQQNYPSYEVIAVNDRSTDQTQAILDGLKSKYPQLQVHQIEKLPEGWFGKNHALHYASQFASGDWILFTDADVSMHQDTLQKAVTFALNHQLDHLTIFEHHYRSTALLNIILLGNYVVYSMFMKPWRIRYRWSKHSLGHGAFNLVKKSAYQSCGGHKAIAMECLDDMKLGELLKKSHYKQDTVDGKDYVARAWYKTAADMIRGLSKNSFAYYDYNFFAVVRDLILASVFFIWPVLSLFFCTGVIVLLNSINIVLMLYVTFLVARHFRVSPKYIFSYPIGIALMLYTICNSVSATYSNKGVVWRGTHYPLNKLRSEKGSN